jgi:hypothetical protein
MITYDVDWAEWLPAEDEPYDLFGNAPECNISDQIDDRTIKSKTFDSEAAAFEFANEKIKNADKWLAYVEVVKITSELLGKLK